MIKLSEPYRLGVKYVLKDKKDRSNTIFWQLAGIIALELESKNRHYKDFEILQRIRDIYGKD